MKHLHQFLSLKYPNSTTCLIFIFPEADCTRKAIHLGNYTLSQATNILRFFSITRHLISFCPDDYRSQNQTFFPKIHEFGGHLDFVTFLFEVNEKKKTKIIQCL